VRERSEPGAFVAPTKGRAVGVGTHGTDALFVQAPIVVPKRTSIVFPLLEETPDVFARVLRNERGKALLRAAVLRIHEIRTVPFDDLREQESVALDRSIVGTPERVRRRRLELFFDPLSLESVGGKGRTGDRGAVDGEWSPGSRNVGLKMLCSMLSRLSFPPPRAASCG
jgi:hypothetical protein